MVHDAQLLLRRGVAGLGLGEDRGVDLLDVARVLADAGERVRERGRDEHGHFVLSVFRRQRAVVVGFVRASEGRARRPRVWPTTIAVVALWSPATGLRGAVRLARAWLAKMCRSTPASVPTPASGGTNAERTASLGISVQLCGCTIVQFQTQSRLIVPAF